MAVDDPGPSRKRGMKGCWHRLGSLCHEDAAGFEDAWVGPPGRRSPALPVEVRRWSKDMRSAGPICGLRAGRRVRRYAGRRRKRNRRTPCREASASAGRQIYRRQAPPGSSSVGTRGMPRWCDDSQTRCRRAASAAGAVLVGEVAAYLVCCQRTWTRLNLPRKQSRGHETGYASASVCQTNVRPAEQDGYNRYPDLCGGNTDRKQKHGVRWCSLMSGQGATRQASTSPASAIC